MIKIDKNWNKRQLTAFFFSYLAGLVCGVKNNDYIREVFSAGSLNFTPTDSQINNWRKTKANTSIFKYEYMDCFINGIFKLKGINKSSEINYEAKKNQLMFEYFLSLLDILKIKGDKQEILKIYDSINIISPKETKLDRWLTGEQDGFNLAYFEIFVNAVNEL